MKKSVEIRELARRCRELRHKLDADSRTSKQLDSLARAFDQLEGLARELERHANRLERDAAEQVSRTG